MTSDAYLGSVPGCILVGENLEVDKSTLNYLGPTPLPLSSVCARGDLISSRVDVPPGEIPTPIALPIGESGQSLSVACSETATGLCWGYMPVIGSAVSRFDWDEKGSILVGTGASAGDAPPYQPTAISVNPGAPSQFLRVNPNAPQCLCWETNPYYGVFTDRGQFLTSTCDGNPAVTGTALPNFLLCYNDACRTGWTPSCARIVFLPQQTEKAGLFVGAGLDLACTYYPLGDQRDGHCLVQDYNCKYALNWVVRPEPLYEKTWNCCDGYYLLNTANRVGDLCIGYNLIEGSCYPEGCTVFASINACLSGPADMWPYKNKVSCFWFEQGYYCSDPISFRWCPSTNTQVWSWQLFYIVNSWCAACPLFIAMPQVCSTLNWLDFATVSFTLHK